MRSEAELPKSLQLKDPKLEDFMPKQPPKNDEEEKMKQLKDMALQKPKVETPKKVENSHILPK